MQRVKYKYSLISACLFLPLIIVFASKVYAQNRPKVSRDYQRFFVHYVDNRSISEKALNLVNLTSQDVGRSFALIAGVSLYPNMSLVNQELRPAAEDLKKIKDYLHDYEFFDEIVVLKEGDVTTPNFEFFLQSYFPRRLKKFPKSRFLFAYSGHGMIEGPNGYLLKNTARSLTDKGNSIKLGVVRVFIDEVVNSGHHVLVLLNACYSGAFLRRSFGNSQRLIPRYPGAHAITAGGTGEQTWHIPSVGKGSVFFETVFAGLDKRADYSGDGLIGVYELFSYLKQEVQISTDQDQNPQVGDLTMHGSKGEFFFLNRDLQVKKGVLPEWKPETATPMGIDADESFIKGKSYYIAENYRSALTLFQQAAQLGSGEAMAYIGRMYEKGIEVNRDYTKAVHWFRKSANAGYVRGMTKLGFMYNEGLGVPRDYAEAAHWYRKAADAGDIPGMSLLGVMYEDGLGVKKDYDQAMRCYLRAANAGDIHAMHNSANMYYEGRGVQRDYAEAAHWYRKAADAGFATAMNNIGYMYEKGLGVKKDYDQAVLWYRKAADAGSAISKKNLKDLGEQR